MTDKKKPIDVIRIGWLRATIWGNDVNGRTLFSTTISRVYKDKNGQWGDSTRFSPDELLTVAKLAELAQSRIMDLAESKVAA